ncbi:energy-coupling factor transporter transmembrane component T family protein [Geomesophilobacter sediminis]|uniref:Energy-coupling factor transporter transmembrane protein EcfT n=1 Tax=Geomesophilobacter sediminis TaxID=2798584 RepID=A0A8J7LV18_9BACT|nr:energy-coupling factor transporter transmembrane component T [Geomesophilobacter sediminis]MBJ6725294.1 energy-coupling factor transporter transmembrane protein EcfT [Geomesophilobacter sediminis]
MNLPLRQKRSSDYACQYLTHDSPLHRLGAGWKIAATTLLSACAVGVRTPEALTLLVLVTLGYYALARLTLYDLWRDLRLVVWQSALIIAAYLALRGAKGLMPGLRTSVQIMVFYLPGAVFLRTTSTRDVMAGLRRIVPYRLSFLLTTSIRFIPFFLREMDEITTAQRLRGARLLPRQQLDPRNWPDLFHCLLLPLMVRALKTAEAVSRSAEARGFGLHRERTYYAPQPESPPSPMAAGAGGMGDPAGRLTKRRELYDDL